MNQADREAFIREQQAKTAARTAPPAEPIDPDLHFTVEQLAAFQAESKRLNGEDPDLLNDSNLRRLTEDGYEFRNEVGARIVRDAAADVVAYLQSDRGQADRCALANVIDSKSKYLAEYERIKAWVRRNGLYQKPVFIQSDNWRTDEYLQDRAQERRNGSRRPL